MDEKTNKSKEIKKFIENLPNLETRILHASKNCFFKIYKSETLRPSIESITILALESVKESGFFPARLSLAFGILLEQKFPPYDLRYFYGSNNNFALTSFLIDKKTSLAKTQLTKTLNSLNIYDNLDNYAQTTDSKYKFLGILTVLCKVSVVIRNSD